MPATASTKAIDFPSIRQALDFLCVCLETPHFGVARKDLDSLIVHEEEQRCAVVLDCAGLDERRRDSLTHAAEQGQAEFLGSLRPLDHGSKFTINSLLDSVQLVPSDPSPELRADETRTVLITLPRPSGGRKDILGDVYATIPKRGYGSSQYAFVDPNEANGFTRSLIFIKDVAPHFDLWAWAEANREFGPRVFYPYDSSPGCALFVQVGRQFPVREALRLYDPEQNEFVLLAEDAARTGRLTLKIRGDEHGGFFIRPQQVFDMRLSRGAQVATLALVAPPEAPHIPMDLVADPTPRQAREGIEEIEREIEAHNKHLRQLDARRQRVLRGRVSECYVAYVFEETAARRLPAALRRFIEQPRSHLAHYSYGYAARLGPRGAAAHIVVSTTPVSTASILSSGAERTYVRPLEWAEWGLPLFVKRWVELRPRIDEQDAVEPLLARLRQRLHDLGQEAPDPEAFWLAEPATEGVALAPMRFTCVAGTRGLTDCIGLLNTLDIETVHTVAREAQERHEELRQAAAVNISQALAEFEGELLAEAADRTGKAAADWHEVVQRLRDVIQRTRATESQVTEIDAALSEAVASWQNYVNRVLDANAKLTQPGVGAFKSYEGGVEDLATRIKQVQEGQANAEREVKARSSEIDRSKNAAIEHARRVAGEAQKLLHRADAAKAEIDKAMDELSHALARGNDRVAEIAQYREKLALKRGEVQERLLEARAAVAGAQQDLDDIEAEERQARRLNAEADDLRRQAEDKRGETEEALRRATAELAAQVRRLDEIREQHERRVAEAGDPVEKAKHQAEQLAAQLDAEWRARKQQEETLAAQRLQKVREDYELRLSKLRHDTEADYEKKLDGLRQEIATRERELREAGQRLRDTAAALGLQAAEARRTVDSAAATTKDAEACRLAIEGLQTEAAALQHEAEKVADTAHRRRADAEREQQRLRQEVAEANKALRAAEEEHGRVMLGLATQARSLLEQIAERRKRLDADMSEARRKLEEERSKHEADLRARQQAFEREIAELNAGYDKRIAELKAYIADREKGLAARKNEIEAALAAERDRLLRPIADQEARLTEDHRRKLAALQEEKRAKQAELDALRAEHDRRRKEWESELGVLKRAREELVATLGEEVRVLGAKQQAVQAMTHDVNLAIAQARAELVTAEEEEKKLEFLKGVLTRRQGQTPPPIPEGERDGRA